MKNITFVQNYKVMKSFMSFGVLAVFASFVFTPLAAQTIVEYQSQDSIEAIRLMKEIAKLKNTDEKEFFIAKSFVGILYGGVEKIYPDKENLLVSFQKMDCVTFVENVLALVWAQKREAAHPTINPFATFCRSLQDIRYRNGKIEDYTSRLHYTTQWIADPAKNPLIYEAGGTAYTAKQHIDLNYMSSHPNAYPEMRKNPAFQRIIYQQERKASGKTIFYIPKDKLSNTQMSLGIKNGDILAVVTDQAGLDVSHMGIAIWINGKLHMIHASSLQKRVIIDEITLFDYMKNKTHQLGIRVFRLKI